VRRHIHGQRLIERSNDSGIRMGAEHIVEELIHTEAAAPLWQRPQKQRDAAHIRVRDEMLTHRVEFSNLIVAENIVRGHGLSGSQEVERAICVQ
jgi:hypothetical protein